MSANADTLPPTRPVASIAALVAFVALALIAGWIGSLATAPNIPTWYAGLVKPSFNPPNAVFPVVWTVLYIVMGFAAWLVWRTPADKASRRTALIAWFVQLALNVLWSFAFFGAHSPLAGLIVIVALLIAIVVTILAFRRVDGLAALLLVPYLAWVGFATILNAAIFSLNA
jgi:tryptophan-rich sensory protein